ncbi:MAG: anti-sigma factor antagonist [Thermoleophilaceae bacterium]|nr:anti-sigma factor antagonist [Thermoleophilaceae bacterium]
MTDFEITSDNQGDKVHVRMRGDLDISTAPRLEEELRRVEAQAPATLVLDLQELAFMDSTGLRLLITADARARDQSRRLVLVRGSEMIQRVLRVTRLDERLDIVDDADAVLAGSA